MSLGLLALRAFVVLCVALLTGTASYLVLQMPAPDRNQFGVRGMRRMEAQHSSSLFASVEPVLRWLGARLLPLLGTSARRRIRRQLVLSGDPLGLLAEEFLAVSLLSGLAGAAVGGLYAAALGRGSLYTALGAAFGGLAPYLKCASLEGERTKRILRSLPHVIDSLNLGLSAGLDLPAALAQVVDKSTAVGDPLIDELKIVLRELQLGKTRKHALLQFAERAPFESVGEFVSVIVQAEERGNSLAQVLEIQAVASRQGRSTRAEEAASHAGVKMLGPMLMIFGAIMLLIVAPMVLSMQDTFAQE